MNTTFNKLIQKSIPYMFIILIAYIISTIIFIYFPKNGIDYIEKSSSFLEYKKYDGFYSKASTLTKPKEAIKKVVKKERLLDYNLKAIYSTNSNSGWITIENKLNKKSYILSQYEDVDGYILTKLYKNYVIMEKGTKEYRLDIKQVDKNISYNITEIKENIIQNIIVDGSSVKIKRNYLNSYIKDIDKVWNNIAIEEIRENDKIEGFKIKKIVKNSVFGKLGLKKNDIIKSINNNILTSYSDAFRVYDNISNTKYLNIEVLRNNEILELNYEID